jgi:hypothetical protein
MTYPCETILFFHASHAEQVSRSIACYYDTASPRTLLTTEDEVKDYEKTPVTKSRRAIEMTKEYRFD